MDRDRVRELLGKPVGDSELDFLWQEFGARHLPESHGCEDATQETLERFAEFARDPSSVDEEFEEEEGEEDERGEESLDYWLSGGTGSGRKVACGISSELDLKGTRAAGWRSGRTVDRYGLSYLVLPKGQILWSGENPRQKKKAGLFFAFSERFARRYGTPVKIETSQPLRLLENHYPVELEECCLRNGRLLRALAEDRLKNDPERKSRVLRSIREVVESDFPTSPGAISMDTALDEFVCDLGMDGWIRLNVGDDAVEMGSDEAMLCRSIVGGKIRVL